MASKKKTSSVRKAAVAKAGRRAAPKSVQKRAEDKRKFDESKYDFMRFMNSRIDYVLNQPQVKTPTLNSQQLLSCRQNAQGMARKDASDPFVRVRMLHYFLNGLEEFFRYNPKPVYN